MKSQELHQYHYNVFMDFKFNRREIKASAKYRITRQEVKTVCDL